MISILLVEDHVVMGKTLSRVLQEWEEVHMWALVQSAEAALQKLAAFANETEEDPPGEANWPNLVLVDISLPDMNGIELVAEIQRYYPNLPCLILSGHQEIHYVRRSLAAGARGYIEKGNLAAIVQAIEQVLDGEIYLSDAMRQALTSDQF